MNFDSIPGDYSSLYGPVVYSLYDCDPAAVTDVEIVDALSEATLGVKRLCGEDFYSFNAAGYLRKSCSIYPAAPYQRPMLSARPGHTVKIEARMGLLRSPVSLLAASQAAVRPGAILSGGPAVRMIAYDEYDEMSMIVRNANLKAVFKFTGSQKSCTVDSNTLFVLHDMVTLSFGLVEMAAILAAKGVDIRQFDSMNVVIYSNGAIMAVQEYQLCQPNPNAVRIAWLNEQGAVDCYSFVHTVKQTMEFERTEGISDAGDHISHSIRSQTIAMLTSGFEPHGVIQWTAGMLSSPLVWIVTAEQYQRILVTDSRAVIENDRPARLSISYKPAGTLLYQNML